MALKPQRKDFSMRPSNKEVPYFDTYDDIFDQYVESDPFDASQNPSGQDSLDDFRHLFEFSASSSGTEAADSWQDGPQFQRPSPALPFPQCNPNLVYADISGRASASDTQISSLNGFGSLQIRADLPVESAPTSPSSTRTRKRPIDRTTLYHTSPRQKSPAVKGSPSQISTSKSMMRPSYYRTGLQRFHSAQPDLSAEHRIPHYQTTVPSMRRSQYATVNSQNSDDTLLGLQYHDPEWPEVSYGQVEQSYESKSFAHPRKQELTPAASPRLMMTETSPYPHINPSLSAFSYDQVKYADGLVLQTPPNTAPLPTGSWPGSPPVVQHHGLPGSSNFYEPSSQPWWSSRSADQPSPANLNDTRAEYAELRNEPTTLHSTASKDLAKSGLMIECEPFEMLQTLAPSPTADIYDEPPTLFTEEGNASPTFLPTTPSMSGAPRTPSPSPPAAPAPSSRRRRSSSRPRQSHHRRKSSGQSNGRSPAGGFVNFTPDDSRKILTGVAPSGSSKTKARREKEADDKRRKLSEAAKRAIMEVGGDFRVLEREGLIMGSFET